MEEEKLGLTIHAVRRKCEQIGPEDWGMYSDIIDADEDTTFGDVIREYLRRDGLGAKNLKGMHFEVEVDLE